MKNIHTEVFNYKNKMKMLRIGEPIIEIREDGVYLLEFRGSSLENLLIPSFITHIGKIAFICNKNLKKVDLNNVKVVMESAFEYCINLEKVTSNDKLIRIEKSAFFKCEKLNIIDIPSKSIDIDSTAFDGCCNIRRIIA